MSQDGGRYLYGHMAGKRGNPLRGYLYGHTAGKRGNMRKTKIICTLGPATDAEGVLEKLVLEGMDVARFNFSHGSHEEQKKRLDMLKEISGKHHRYIGALLDTKGPEIRIGCFENGKIDLVQDQIFCLTPEECSGNEDRVSITYQDLYKDVNVGSRILIDDGLIEMEVKEVKGHDIYCLVKNGGTISNRKGINVPDTDLRMPFVSQKDYEDIVFGVEQGFDFIACSFTRSAEDILEIRKILQEKGGERIQLIAKIENSQGVKNIDEIIAVTDGIMIARGDMGVELPMEDVPVIQKEIIQKVYRAGKKVITATQMLDSMMKHPRPTRAEATDVSNAIYQGTSAIMLSGETAAGMYPVEALRTMVKIAVRTEDDIDYNQSFSMYDRDKKPDMTTAISHATCTTAMDLGATAIITVTKSGQTARMISKYRPGCMIVGCSTEDYVCRQLSMSWGVQPLQIREEYSMEILFLHASEAAERAGLVKEGDVVVLTAGVPLGKAGNTNILKTAVIGEI